MSARTAAALVFAASVLAGCAAHAPDDYVGTVVNVAPNEDGKLVAQVLAPGQDAWGGWDITLVAVVPSPCTPGASATVHSVYHFDRPTTTTGRCSR